jgi:hypothetical protein
MSSRVAAVVTRLSSAVSPSGIGPPPVPPTATFPYITVHEVMDDELENLVSPSGLVKTVMQVNSWSPDYEAAAANKKACKDALLTGFIGSFAGQNVDSVNYQGGYELRDPARNLHQCISRFLIWWESA